MLEKLKSLFFRKQVSSTQPTETPPASPTHSPPKPHIFTLDKRIINALEAMAAEEDCSAEQLAHDLLDEGIRRRQTADAWLEVWHTLTPREKQAAGLICLGYTNDEMALQMSISPNTVKTHVKKILMQFKVSSKADLRELLEDWDFTDWVEGSLN